MKRKVRKAKVVYLIHFGRKHHHAQHYLGSAVDLSERIQQHRDGSGANLLRTIQAAGIEWEVVRTWEGDKTLERQLKNRKSAPRLCPICREQRKLACKR